MASRKARSTGRYVSVLGQKPLQRADHGVPRILPRAEFERFCEVIAALKIRTSNKKGRHLSTVQAIRLLEEHGVETPDGLLRAPKAVLSRSTVNRYLKQWGFDYATLTHVPLCVFRPVTAMTVGTST